jgi:hypothetical protein
MVNMPNAFEIREHYEGIKSGLLLKTFDLAAAGKGADPGVSSEVRGQLSERDLAALQAAQGVIDAETERQRLKDAYVEAELELRAALEQRGEAIEEELRPKGASFADLAAAADATTEALKTAFSVADENGQRIALAVARERNNDELISYIADRREDWSALLAELEVIAAEPEFAAPDAFETFAEPAPSRGKILTANKQPTSNVLGAIG